MANTRTNLFWAGGPRTPRGILPLFAGQFAAAYSGRKRHDHAESPPFCPWPVTPGPHYRMSRNITRRRRSTYQRSSESWRPRRRSGEEREQRAPIQFRPLTAVLTAVLESIRKARQRTSDALRNTRTRMEASRRNWRLMTSPAWSLKPERS